MSKNSSISDIKQETSIKIAQKWGNKRKKKYFHFYSSILGMHQQPHNAMVCWLNTNTLTDGTPQRTETTPCTYSSTCIVQNISPDRDPNQSNSRKCLNNKWNFVIFTAYVACRTSNICCKIHEVCVIIKVMAVN